MQNEVPDDHQQWLNACRERQDQVSWIEIDITRSDWLESIKGQALDGLLATPPAFTMPFETLFDERVSILAEELKMPVYPSLTEIRIYENKKYLAYWLKAHEVACPKTWVFYYEKEALNFLEKAEFPIVGKTNIGASGRGVIILKDRKSARRYVENLFSGKGAQRSVGPRWKKRGFVLRLIRKIMQPKAFAMKLKQYQRVRADVQSDFVLLQEFIPHDFEWRCVRIGDSYFAHKKIKAGDKASGTLIKGYETPPIYLLDFVRELTEKHQLFSQAVDVFFTPEHEILVNEMQCLFGQSDPYQMLINDQPGRYIYQRGQWVFEPGDFNRFESYLLRLDHFLELLKKRNPKKTTSHVRTE